MSWFKRSEKGIHTKTEEKKDIPKGLWYQTPTGKIIEAKELAENKYVSPEDDTTFILEVKNTSKSYLITTRLKNSIQPLSPRIF